MFDLLSDNLIRVVRRGGVRDTISLPEVYQWMVADEIIAFPAQRPHQRHAWHAFLAQLGTIALTKASLSELPPDVDTWRSLLRALTQGFDDDEPWHLIVDDPAVPAFMQCPAVTGLSGYKSVRLAPDDHDLLVRSKNHDIKVSTAFECEADDWVFALIAIQTMAGFQGAGNYGIARMNGGYSSRPCLGLAPANGGPGAHLVHDVRLMVERRAAILEEHPDYFRGDDRSALLWLDPWDGTDSLTLQELDPYFIEICRRIRLVCRDGRIVGLTATSKKPRISAKEAHGNVGDYWTPIGTDGKALSVSRVGFRYDRLAKLIIDQSAFRHPRSMTLESDPGGSWRLVARGVAGGQGKTEGYHERSDIVFGPSVGAAISFGARRDRLEQIAKNLLREIEEVSKALRFAIAVAASGGKDGSSLGKPDREKAFPYLRQMDSFVDSRFFAALQDRFDASGEHRETERQRFVKELINQAEGLLKTAVEAVPCASIQRHRARARASSAFRGMLWRSPTLDLEQVFPTPEPEAEHV